MGILAGIFWGGGSALLFIAWTDSYTRDEPKLSAARNKALVGIGLVIASAVTKYVF